MHILKVMLIFMVLAVAACGGGGGSTNDGGSGSDEQNDGNGSTNDQELPAGSTVYMEPREGGNTFACVYCHALTEPADDGFMRPGHAISDAPKRPSFKNGQLTKFVDAVNICLTEWMGVPDPWTEDTAEYKALVQYLNEQDQSEGEVQALTFQKQDPLVFENADDVQGDATAGQDKFNQSCAICHGQNAVGTDRAPQLAGVLEDPNYIARRVRLSGNVQSAVYPDLIGGRMPFWSEDRITDEEIENIIEYLLASEDSEVDDDDTGGPIGGETRECSSTRPEIGQTALINGHFHDVAGVATIVDDCTIRISSFTFDGRGIDVRVYGAIDSNFDDNGFNIGPNLVSDSAYDNVTFTIQLPEDKSFDDMNSLSIWCVPAKTSFGDGEFE